MFYAQEEARNCEASCVASEHILLGCLVEEDWKPPKLLEQLNCPIEQIRPAVKKLRVGLAHPSHIPLAHSPESKAISEAAFELAKGTPSGAILPEHIFLALFSDEDYGAAKILADLGVTRDAAEAGLKSL
jgi:ATP-dependent Clp protease ATP-binding subunit ClpA